MPRQSSPILEYKLESKHWSSKLREATIAARLPDRCLHLNLQGGAENGQFCSLGAVEHSKIVYWTGKLYQDDLILEVQGHRVSGFTLHDLSELIENLSKNSQPVLVKTLKPGHLPGELRAYLKTMFKGGSMDHELQKVIRDNLYLRVVPCTTRLPRPGEINGVDYQFLTMDEFMALEKNCDLIESGDFDGNHYGTPKPKTDSASLSRDALCDSLGTTSVGGQAAAPSSVDTTNAMGSLPRGARHRTKSSTEALSTSAKSTPATQRRINAIDTTDSGKMASYRRSMHELDQTRTTNGNKDDDENDDLGPLPTNWEMSHTPEGYRYFIDHNTGSTHWDDPRVPKSAHQSSSDANSTPATPDTVSGSEDLPYGWEKVQDPKYGVFYIDHINKCTQYERPTEQRHRSNGPTENEQHTATKHPPVFTSNPDALQGPVIRTTLVKSPRGFGFTIIGGSDKENPEFLQIKNVVSSGPAAVDGVLGTGDVLVYVNATNVLGYTHSEIVELFQKIAVGENVTLSVCKCYTLPFDPNDPNTRVIRTLAVNPGDTSTTDSTDSGLGPRSSGGAPGSRTPGSTRSSGVGGDSVSGSSSTVTVGQISGTGRSSGLSVASIPTPVGSTAGGVQPFTFLPRDQRPEFIKVNIMKTSSGFGFTIADNLQGQRVKQILESDKCNKLREADILVEINSVRVKEMRHQDVVQILRDCPVNQEAKLLIQRGGIHAMAPPPTSSSPIFSKYNGMDSKNYETSVSVSTPSSRLRSVTPTSGRTSVPPSSRATPPVSSTPVPASTSWRNSAHMPLSVSMELDRRELGNYAVVNYLEQQNMQKSMEAVNEFSNSSLQRPQPTRSRTPGPEVGRSSGDMGLRQATRPKTPTAQEMRGAAGWGAPDFMPASAFLNNQTPSASGRSSVPASYGSLSRPGRMLPLNPTTSSPPTNNMMTSLDGTPITGTTEFEVVLNKHANGFGFRILGGAEERTQVSVGHLVPGGAADKCSLIRQGDKIVSVNGMSVIGATHHSVVKLMEAAGHQGRVCLGIRRINSSVNGAASQPALYQGHSQSNYALPNSVGGTMGGGRSMIPSLSQSEFHTMPSRMKSSQSTPLIHPLQHHQPISVEYPYDVTVTRTEKEGFGFVIISSVTRDNRNMGEVIGKIVEGSPAQRCGLRVKDRLLAVNGMDISRMHHENIVKVIRDSGYQVTLTIGASLDDPSPPGRPIPQPSSRYDAHSTSTSSLSINGGSARPSLPPPGGVLQDLPFDSFSITLHRGNSGFGFSIRGGMEFNQMLYVLKIAESGSAYMDGTLRVGDEILQINGHNTAGMSHAQAVGIIQSGGETIQLVVRRNYSGIQPRPNIGTPQQRRFTDNGMTNGNNGFSNSATPPAIPARGASNYRHY